MLPLDDDLRPNPSTRTVIGAPTPTDEPLTLPALLVGTFPVDDTRRHLARGPLADHLIERAVDAYQDLVLSTPPDHRVALIPPAGFPAGPVDARLRDAVLGALPRLPFLIGADGRPLRPADARVLPGLTDPAAGLFADVVPGLLPWPSSGSAAGIAGRLRSVGAVTLAVAEVSAALAGLERPVGFWRDVYDALAQVLDETGADPEELADLPVPREGGGTIIGPRGVLVRDPGPSRSGLVGSPSSPGSTPLGPSSDLLGPGSAPFGPGPLLEPGSSSLGGDSSWLGPDSSLLGPDSSLLEPSSSLLDPDSSSVNPDSSLLGLDSSWLGPDSSSLGPGSSWLDPGASPPGSTIAPQTSGLGQGS